MWEAIKILFLIRNQTEDNHALSEVIIVDTPSPNIPLPQSPRMSTPSPPPLPPPVTSQFLSSTQRPSSDRIEIEQFLGEIHQFGGKFK